MIHKLIDCKLIGRSVVITACSLADADGVGVRADGVGVGLEWSVWHWQIRNSPVMAAGFRFSSMECDGVAEP